MATYALSDIHGFKSIYDQVKAMLKPEDKVIFLGDAADRGPYGWQCITAILDDPQFEYILGNHDLFLIRSFFGPDGWHNERLWDINGGDMTRASMEGISKRVRNKYLRKLESCPLWTVYENKEDAHIFLSHSGAYTTEPVHVYEMEDFTWNRTHFVKKAPEGVDLVVHGHTPIRYLISKLNDYSDFFENSKDLDGDSDFVPGKSFWYADWTKCDIDSGTVQTGVAVLFNLDTLTDIPIFVSKEEEEFLWR